MRNRHNNQKGFSLIELMIVVGIILIIAAIAIPSLLKARMSANESSAVGSLRTIDIGEVTYAAACPQQGFSPTLDDMNSGNICISGANIIDSSLSVGFKSGYTFTYTAGAPDVTGVVDTYTDVAVPDNVGTTGQRGFYSDQTGVLRYTLDGSAPTNASAALQ